ncbi:MAG TPA: ion transporter [Pyrinomonadaceae bacterium]
MLRRLKEKVYDILIDVEVDKRADRLVALFLMLLIITNGLAVMLETVKALEIRYSHYFYLFELVSVAVFTLEYLLRLWAITLDPVYKDPLTGRLRYALSPMALTDLAAILPFYLPIALTIDLRLLRLLRLFRIFRLFKMTRYVESMRTFQNVFKAKKSELTLTLVLIFLLLIFASSAMYAVENEAQPDKFSSIPETLWWGVITLTTIGYGDIYPVTPLGKIIGGIIAFLGIGLFALPAGILASGFSEELQKRRDKQQK